jgi:signal transduction histidine kinase
VSRIQVYEVGEPMLPDPCAGLEITDVPDLAQIVLIRAAAPSLPDWLEQEVRPVVVVSAGELREQLLRLGAIEVVTRPEELSDVAGDVLARHGRQTLLLAAHERRRQLYGRILDEMPLGILIVDADSVTRFLNLAASKLLGLPRQALIDLPLPIDVLGGRSMDLDVGDEDARRVVHAWAVPVPWSQESGWMVVLEDVTRDRDRARALTRAHDEARRDAELKGAFLANMSHEIRTPLNGVIGMTELLLDTDLDLKQRSYVELARDAGRSLLSLLNGVLDFAKLEAGRMEVESLPFGLSTDLWGALRPLELSAIDKGLGFKLELDEALPAQLVGDSLRIRQVLTNLVANAVKFTEAGHVRVSVELVRPLQHDLLVRFEVEDTGIGVSDAAMARLFQPFSQADASTTRRYGGTGLGLAICRQLVELMGGTLQARSQPGKGTRFWFVLGLGVVEPAQSRSPQLPLPLGQAAPRVLLAEDNAVNQLVLMRLCERIGCVVETVADGAAAVESAMDDRYDLILMDCHMPVVDGFAAAQQLRSRGITTPIIAVTASAEPEDRERARLAGMDDFLSKPVDPQRLSDLVLRVLGAG